MPLQCLSLHRVPRPGAALHCHLVFWALLLAVTIIQIFKLFVTLAGLKNTGQILYMIYLIWELSDTRFHSMTEAAELRDGCLAG